MTGGDRMESSEESEKLNIPEAQVTVSPGHSSRPVTPSPHLPSSAFYASPLTWLARISRFVLAVLFLFTAAAKLAIVKSFAQNMAQLLSANFGVQLRAMVCQPL